MTEPGSKPISQVVIPEAKGATPSRGSMFRKVLIGILTGAIFALIFIKIIPELASYEDIWDEVRAAPAWEIVGLFAMAVVILCLSTAMMVLPIRGIGAMRAFITQQGSTAISNTIPGPSGTGMRFLMLRSYGVDVEDFSRGMVAVSLWNNVCMLSMPGVAVLLLVLLGNGGDHSSTLVGWAIFAVAVSVGLDRSASSRLLRSIGFARWLGRIGQRLTNLCLRLIRKPEVDGWEAAAVTLRANTVTVLKARGFRLTVLTLSNYWLNGILLMLCLRLVGIDSRRSCRGRSGWRPTQWGGCRRSSRSPPVASAWSRWPTPRRSSPSPRRTCRPTITAGVLIYRGFTYVMPIVVGAFCYLGWRLDKGRGVPVTHGPLDAPLASA